MPLPAPLKKGASKSKKRRRLTSVFHELKHGPVNSPSRKSAKRRGTARKQNIAIALRNAGVSRKRKAHKRKARKGGRRG